MHKANQANQKNIYLYQVTSDDVVSSKLADMN